MNSVPSAALASNAFFIHAPSASKNRIAKQLKILSSRDGANWAQARLFCGPAVEPEGIFVKRV
jgi:hypothetical protein